LEIWKGVEVIRIRKATIEDEIKIFNLLRQFAFNQSPLDRQTDAPIFREIVENDEKGTILVAEQDDNMVGVITLSYPVAIHRGGTYTCIEELIVSEQMRGQGIGGQLLETAIAEATSKAAMRFR